MSRDEVEGLLEEAVKQLHPAHRKRFEAMRVPLRTVAVSASPGGSVVVVAEHEGRIVYYSDVEDGWELVAPNVNGGIQERAANQFELTQLMWALFGDPEQLT